jgi:ubiquitin carboxyl-terminal hydrolase 34
MQRSKINDYFNFPHRIDMRPYKVEHLMESPEQTQEDIYELVGILVHAGTAESGHYYSYIRERPSYGQPASWVEFNDDSVTSFDPGCIDANCFGGPDYRGPDNSGPFQFDKSYSAYMLFYQRYSVLQAQQRELYASSLQQVRVPLSRGLSNHIAQENELLIRKYCLYDDGHAPFVLRMLDNAQHVNKGRCSEDHVLEKNALYMTLYHLDQVVCRTKDLPDLPSYMVTLNHKLQACAECSLNFLEWVICNPEAFRQLLFRNPDQVVRNDSASALVRALNKVKHDASYSCYGLYDDSLENDDDDPDLEYTNPRIFIKVLTVLRRFWETFHLSARAWPEYFGLLVNIAQLGPQETAILLDMSFLRRALEVISADPELPLHPQYTRMLTIVSKRPITKPVSYENVIALAEVLLKACDLSVGPIPDEDPRLELLLEEQPVPLSASENQLLTQHWTRGIINILLEKLLMLNQNERSTQSILVILLHKPGVLQEPIINAIRAGIRKAANAGPAAPYLRAALTYCEHTDSDKYIEFIIQHVTNTTRMLDNADGKEYLRFFKDLLELTTNRSGVPKENFVSYVLEQIPNWAPSLLTYYDATVRTETEDYVQQTVLRYALEQSLDPLPEIQDKAEILQVGRLLGVSCLRYLHEEHVRPRVQAVRATLYSIQAVIDHCRRLFDEQSDDEQDVQFYDLFSGKSLLFCII